MIPRFNVAELAKPDQQTLDRLAVAARELGFLVVTGASLSADDIRDVIASYRNFFAVLLPECTARNVPYFCAKHTSRTPSRTFVHCKPMAGEANFGHGEMENSSLAAHVQDFCIKLTKQPTTQFWPKSPFY